ncbi:isopentenyl-diphosphate Delta-isomerase [Corynebacterium sp. HMSC29G08]|uniref:isopentenyl-diphosphate Delta-isomerase n=1 Tax=Corynebacterium sp. HMSC29G08 TaxID=1581069 RepID=UPI0008A4C743|nr:isopentenyl-diphosphate Delta-isomerase [Corynebacterium sp. HMSC29G08]OFT85097.1 isopentenyl-diphosphate delta-isomerase [Corynebacterium sp. HMSC29G08]
MREEVTLLSDSGSPIGTADKAEVHTGDTPLHLAFSCWLFNEDGQLLLTRRALGKKTWPGVWTNSFCGHPGPGEDVPAAILRRSVEELRLPAGAVLDVTPVLPEFRYRAVDSSGIVEYEICPVYSARLAPGHEALDPNPDEVDAWHWADPADVVRAADATPFAFSPWLVEELADPRLRAVLERAGR